MRVSRPDCRNVASSNAWRRASGQSSSALILFRRVAHHSPSVRLGFPFLLYKDHNAPVLASSCEWKPLSTRNSKFTKQWGAISVFHVGDSFSYPKILITRSTSSIEYRKQLWWILLEPVSTGNRDLTYILLRGRQKSDSGLTWQARTGHSHVPKQMFSNLHVPEWFTWRISNHVTPSLLNSGGNAFLARWDIL